MKCKTCFHPQRAAIDLQIVAGASLRSVAQQFGLSKTSLSRHRRHLFKQLLPPHVQHLRILGQLEQEVRRTLEEARENGDSRLTLAASREAARLAERIVDIWCLPTGYDYWEELSRALAVALHPYPQAKQAAIRAIRKVIDAGE